MNGSGRIDTLDLIAELVHDLRQPLGNLEYSACCLQILLGESHAAVQQQLRVMQQQIDLATRLLSETAARLPNLGLQRVDAAESLDLTNSETAAVT